MARHNMSTCTMRQLEERHVATKVELMVWCNKMDLLALSNVKGEVALHRLTWQKVWSLPPPSEGTTVKGLAWRPDGKVIAIAYSTSEVLLVDVENKEILHVNHIDGPISSLCWVQEKEIDPATIPNLNIPFQDGQFDFLPKLPSLNRSFDAQSEGLEENFEDSKKVKDQAQLNFLLVGTSDGRVYIKIFGLFSCGVLVDKEGSVVLEANISPDMKELFVIVSAKDGEQNVLKLLVFDTRILFSHSKELHALALKYGHIISLLDYLALTMHSITEAWENILLLEMESKLASYAESKPDGSVSADFLELLMFGIASDPLERFLLQELTDKGIKKLGHSIELSHSNIQKLILKHLHSVGQGLAYHLAEMKGMARLTNRFQLLGLEDELVSDALTAAGAFLVKATEVQLVIDDSMKKYKAFFRWLFAVILKATDDRIPDMALTGVNQQDLAFIADYLYSLDGVSSLTLKDGKKQHCYLDRLGQYLVDHELTNPSKSGNNPWEELMKQNPCLANHPSIIPRYEKMSLVQQHKHFKNSIESLFESSEGAISNLFEVVSTVIISRISNRPQFTWTMGDDKKLLLAFICQDDTMFRFIEVLPEEDPLICNCIDVFFSKIVSTEETGRMKVLDIEFYSPDTLSVLLEQGVENRSAVFIQLPTKSVRQYTAQLGALTIPSIEGNTLLEPGVLKPVDNMVASNFAVSGKRRVAVILSESRRKVRLFEMEVDEEEEDEEAMDGTLTSNQESDTSVLNCSKESIDDEVMKINDIDLD